MKLDKTFSIILLVFTTILFYILNTQVPFFSDDIGWASLSWPSEIIEKASYIIECQKDFWVTQNGRIVNHTILQIMCMCGNQIFDIFNALLFLGTILLLVKLCFGDKKATLLPILLSVLALRYFIPDTDSLLYWAAGACNYLLPMAFAIGFLLVFKNCSRIHKYIFPLAALFSFLAGWTHEIFSLPIAFTLCLYVLIHRKDITLKELVLAFCYCVGALLVAISPGSLHRFMVTQGNATGSTPIFATLTHKLLTGFKIFHYGRWFYIQLGLVAFLAISKKNSLKGFLKENAFYLSCLLCSLGIIMILGVGGRAVWAVEVFALIIILKWLSQQKWIYTKVCNYCCLLLSCMVIGHQMFLIAPNKEAWKTYQDAVAQSNDGQKTVHIIDWNANNKLIDPFVAHPYQMLREDMWMRIPIRCEVCREDIYQDIVTTPSWDGPKCIGETNGDWIIPFDSLSMQAIQNGKFQYALAPISYEYPGGYLYLTWHQLIQKIMPSRYPTQLVVSKEQTTILTIEGEKYIRFEQPFTPIPRIILNISKIESL